VKRGKVKSLSIPAVALETARAFPKRALCEAVVRLYDEAPGRKGPAWVILGGNEGFIDGDSRRG
jgi:hypothetical protein